MKEDSAHCQILQIVMRMTEFLN